MGRLKFVTSIFLISLILNISVAYPLGIPTHEAINRQIAEGAFNGFSLDSYLKINLGFAKGKDELIDEQEVWMWIRDAGRYEDEPPWAIPYIRSMNHFHNPLEPWNDAGLYDVFIGMSSVIWAQDQSSANIFNGGNWSWQKARENFYTALTGKDFNGDIVASTQQEREKYFAKTFRAVGQVMHLVQDSSVPAHVRNDSHIWGDGYEGWVEDTTVNNRTLFNSLIATPLVFVGSILNETSNPFAPIPIAKIFDTDKYNNGVNPSTSLAWGISEYANSNFVSDDTIFTESFDLNHIHYFPYPRYSTQNYEIYEIDIPPDKKRVYLRKTGDGETMEHFATVGPLYKYLSFDPVLQRDELELDAECFKDYAQKLLPRAVGYSAGLLDYFFRGNIEITPPDQVAYAVTDGSQTPYVDSYGNYHQQFRSIKAKLRNITPKEKDAEGNILSYEDMQNGTLQALAKYKIIPNYMYDLSNYPPDGNVMKDIEYTYSVSAPIEITSLSSTEPTEFSFNFSTNPIPAGITDLYLFIVFKGTLGNETDIAIAVGMKDLMEPTHQVFWNLTDMFSLDNHLYTSMTIHIHLK